MNTPALSSRTLNSYLNDAVVAEFLMRQRHRLAGTVLDIGCGSQRYRDAILSAPNVARYVGLDVRAGLYVYASKADVYWNGVEMPLADESVDSAILFEVVEHCADPRIVVAEGYRVLKPGGCLLFSVPFTYQLHGVPFDYQRLTPAGARHLFGKAGFVPVAVEPSGAWDASLAQMVAIWITHRPLPRIVRLAARHAFVPIFRLLLWLDRRHRRNEAVENDMMPGILGLAIKPMGTRESAIRQGNDNADERVM
jgi:SAM-dependent methyltransferase